MEGKTACSRPESNIHLSPESIQKIDSMIKSNPVFLFMKGTPDFPRCGFSSGVVNILRSHGVQFNSLDILNDQEMRQAVKEYSNWPTYPQLYIKGKLIGGHDIVHELNQEGELSKLLK